MNSSYKAYCAEIYNSVYNDTYKIICGNSSSERKHQEAETAAQKEAIKQAAIHTMKKYPDTDGAMIWKSIYEIHIHRKSGIDNADTIERVISADQSWKKSSGHAFEEMIKLLASSALGDSSINIVLQRDLNTMIKDNEIANEPRDLSWLREQIAASVFDLYAVVRKSGKKYCYGCIQSKTSIRDRVTRDREPSIQAMQSFFWSIIMVLDGDFLKNPKFVSMVNGGSTEHPANGWHGMYVFSRQSSQDRIYSTDLDLSIFREHAIKAAEWWLTQRQWFNNEWRPDNA